MTSYQMWCKFLVNIVNEINPGKINNVKRSAFLSRLILLEETSLIKICIKNRSLQKIKKSTKVNFNYIYLTYCGYYLYLLWCGINLWFFCKRYKTVSRTDVWREVLLSNKRLTIT